MCWDTLTQAEETAPEDGPESGSESDASSCMEGYDEGQDFLDLLDECDEDFSAPLATPAHASPIPATLPASHKAL